MVEKLTIIHAAMSDVSPRKVANCDLVNAKMGTVLMKMGLAQKFFCVWLLSQNTNVTYLYSWASNLEGVEWNIESDNLFRYWAANYASLWVTIILKFFPIILA